MPRPRRGPPGSSARVRRKRSSGVSRGVNITRWAGGWTRRRSPRPASRPGSYRRSRRARRQLRRRPLRGPRPPAAHGARRTSADLLERAHAPSPDNHPVAEASHRSGRAQGTGPSCLAQRQRIRSRTRALRPTRSGRSSARQRGIHEARPRDQRAPSSALHHPRRLLAQLASGGRAGAAPEQLRGCRATRAGVLVTARELDQLRRSGPGMGRLRQVAGPAPRRGSDLGKRPWRVSARRPGRSIPAPARSSPIAPAPLGPSSPG